MLVSLQSIGPGFATTVPNMAMPRPGVSERPKPVPWITTRVLPRPELREILVMEGDTVKNTPLLSIVPTWTTTLPRVAPFGTATVMLVALQQVLQGVAVVPLNFTVLDP